MYQCQQLSAIAIAATFISSLVHAQAVAPPVGPLTPLSQTGKVVSGDVRGLQFEVLGTRYVAFVDAPNLPNNPTVVELNAKAKGSFLQPGMCVQFEAKLDPKGKRVLAPISQLTIFTPVSGTQFGAFPNNFAAPLSVPALVPAPAVGAAPAAAPLVPAAEHEDGMMFVVAQVSRVRKSEVQLQVPGGKIEGRLADDVKMDVNVTDKKVALSMLRPGDMVQIDGSKAPDGKFYAMKIVATLERPLGEDFPSKGKKPTLGGDKSTKEVEVAEGAVDPREDFGAAATAAAEEAARAATPTRARILKVN